MSSLYGAAQESPEARWKGLQFLFGNWTGVGNGIPGQGSGKCSFQPELNGQVVVRHSYNNLANGQRHDDLAVESSGPQKGRIECFRPVCRGHDDYAALDHHGARGQSLAPGQEGRDTIQRG